MTAQLDPYEIYADDAPYTAQNMPEEEWDLGVACDLTDTECEACQ